MLISAGGGAAGNEQHNEDDNGMTCQLLCTAIYLNFTTYSVPVKTKKANNAGNKQPGDDASKSTLSSSQFCFILAAPQSIPSVHSVVAWYNNFISYHFAFI